jgi:hypothetical protein
MNSQFIPIFCNNVKSQFPECKTQKNANNTTANYITRIVNT